MNAQVNLALEAVTAVFLLLTAAPFFVRNRSMPWSAKRIGLILAITLHLLATFRLLAGDVERVTDVGPEFSAVSGVFVLVLELFSVLALAFCVFCDEDGKLRVAERGKPVSITQLLEAILPSALAVPLLLYLRGVNLHGFTYAVSLFLITVTMVKDWQEERTERGEELTARQGRVMTERLQPHFIFNALSTIEALCVIDPDAAAASVDDFAGYLRGSIDALSAEEPIPFERELEHIRQYASLERADPGRQFELVYELGVTDFSLPARTVLPVVESAIRHGALTRRDGSGRVLLRTEEVGDRIRVIVEDNGLSETAEEKRGDHFRTVMKDVEHRLASRCGGTIHVRGGENGTRAVITLRRDPEPPKEREGRR